MESDAESGQLDSGSARGTELSAEEQAIVSQYPPASTLEPEPGAIRAAAERLTRKPEQGWLEAAYREAVEFADYWTEVYETLRLRGVKALEEYYDPADLWEVESPLDALDAVLWALRSDIVKSKAKQRAMGLKFGLRNTSGTTVARKQLDLF